MGLAVAVFVPEGIVLASDGLAEIRNSEKDKGFLHKRQETIFSYKDRFLICVHGGGYIKNRPYSYFIRQVFATLLSVDFNSTEDFAMLFKDTFYRLVGNEKNVSFYIAGMDMNESLCPSPSLFLLDKNVVSLINRGLNNDIVYNYHSIGRCLWINKMLLHTSCEIDKGQKVEFESVDIDFSKYSISDAIDFSKTLLTISFKMDAISQLSQMVGEYVSVGYVTIFDKLKIKGLC